MTEQMTPLRRRMIDDMTIRNMVADGWVGKEGLELIENWCRDLPAC